MDATQIGQIHTKVSNITNIKLGTAIGFLGISILFAAGLAANNFSLNLLACAMDETNKCKEKYRECALSCPSLPTLMTNSCKQSCLETALAYSKLPGCGNAVVEEGEICDGPVGFCINNCQNKSYLTIKNPVVNGNVLEIGVSPWDRDKIKNIKLLDANKQVYYSDSTWIEKIKQIDSNVENIFFFLSSSLMDKQGEMFYLRYSIEGETTPFDIPFTIGEFTSTDIGTFIQPRFFQGYASTKTGQYIDIIPKVAKNMEKDIVRVDALIEIAFEDNYSLGGPSKWPMPQGNYYNIIKKEDIPLNHLTSIPLLINKMGLYKYSVVLKYTLKSGVVIFKGQEFNDSIVEVDFEAPKLFSLNDTNDLEDANRINLIFLMQNGWELIPEDERLAYFEKILNAGLNGKISLSTTEPYKSNLDKFNFLYLKDILPIDAESGLKISSDINPEVISSLNKYQKMRLSMSLPNMVYATLNVESNYDFNSAGGKLCAPIDAIQITGVPKNIKPCLEKGFSEQNCFEQIAVGRLLMHELMHELAYGGEEYPTKDIFDPEAYTSLWKTEHNIGLSGDGAYYSTKIKESDCKFEPFYTVCTAPVSAISDCTRNARWKDLLGNGCGEDGIVDCNKNNPLYKYEVTCQHTNAGWPLATLSANLIKPTNVSLMSDRSEIFDVKTLYTSVFGGIYTYYDTLYDYQGRLYGQVNERQLCRYLEDRLGSVGGICDSLCMKGCSQGFRCVKGACQSTASLTLSSTGGGISSEPGAYIADPPSLGVVEDLKVMLPSRSITLKLHIFSPTMTESESIHIDIQSTDGVYAEKFTLSQKDYMEVQNLDSNKTYILVISRDGYTPKKISIDEQSSEEVIHLGDVREAYVRLERS